MIGRLRSLTPPWFVILGVIFFLTAEAFMQAAERRLGIPALDLKVRPSLVVLSAIAALYGAYRAMASHPFFDVRYRDWLAQTPWTVAKPLPLDSIQLGGRDAVVLGLLVALNLIVPQRDSMRILCMFLSVHCAALTMANWWTANRAYSYLAVFGLALMIRLWLHPWACIATGTVVYLVVHEGVWQALRAFPWEPNYALVLFPDVAVRDGKVKPAPCGWPYDRLLRDPTAKTGAPETGLDALIWCMLLGWWISCLESRFTDRDDAVAFTKFCMAGVFVISLVGRGVTYVVGYRAPLSLLGRIMCGRWIIPDYDVVFLAPILLILAPAAATLGFMNWGVPIDIYGPIILALIAFIALQTPPRLKKWRLTGGHRMVNVGGTSSSGELTGVGSSMHSS